MVFGSIQLQGEQASGSRGSRGSYRRQGGSDSGSRQHRGRQAQLLREYQLLTRGQLRGTGLGLEEFRELEAVRQGTTGSRFGSTVGSRGAATAPGSGFQARSNPLYSPGPSGSAFRQPDFGFSSPGQQEQPGQAAEPVGSDKVSFAEAVAGQPGVMATGGAYLGTGRKEQIEPWDGAAGATVQTWVRLMRGDFNEQMKKQWAWTAQQLGQAVPMVLESFRSHIVPGSRGAEGHVAIVKALLVDMKSAGQGMLVSPAVPDVPALEKLVRGTGPEGEVAELEAKVDATSRQVTALMEVVRTATARASEETLEGLDAFDMLDAEVLKKGSSSSSDGGCGSKFQLPEGATSITSTSYLTAEGRPINPLTQVVEKYFSLVEKYFGEPTDREVAAFMAMALKDGEDPENFAARLSSKLQVFRNSKQRNNTVSEQQAVELFLNSVGRRQEYEAAVKQMRTPWSVLSRDSKTLGKARELLGHAMQSVQEEKVLAAQRCATLQALGMEGGGEGQGAGKDKGGKGSGLVPTDTAKYMATYLNGWNPGQLQKLHRAAGAALEGQGGARGEASQAAASGGNWQGATGGAVAAYGAPGGSWQGEQPGYYAAAALGGAGAFNQGGGQPGTAFGQPRPGPLGWGGNGQGGRGQGLLGGPGGRGQGGNGGQWGGGGRGGQGGRGGGANGAGRGWQGQGGRVAGQQQQQQLPAGALREPAAVPCECANPRHHADQVCYTSNPWHCQQAQKPGPPPGTLDYATHLRHCQRLGLQPTRQPMARGAAVLALQQQGQVEEPYEQGAQQLLEFYPFCGSLGGASDATLAGCVPDQEGWHFNNCSSGPAPSQVQVAAAVGTRGSSSRGGVAGGSRTPSSQGVVGASSWRAAGRERLGGEDGVEVEVCLMVGRDDDILAELWERGRQVPGEVSVAAAAAGQLRSFLPRGQQVALQQALQWTEGKVLAKTSMLWPRDQDLLDELRARTAVVGRIAREQQQAQEQQQQQPEQGATAAAAVSCNQPVGLAEEQYREWQQNEGGLVYFVNGRAEQGVGFSLPDGRFFLPRQVLYDTGCEPPIMSEVYGVSMGLRPESLPEPRFLIRADGKLATIDRQFRGISVVLARNTPHQVAFTLNFLCMPHSEKLYQATFPTVLDHKVGGLGVDRVDKVYRYRPGYAASGDKATVASIPVRCWRSECSQAGAAAAALSWREVGQGEWEAAAAAVDREVQELTAAIFSSVREGLEGAGKVGSEGEAGQQQVLWAAPPTSDVAQPAVAAAGLGQPGAAVPAAAARDAGLQAVAQPMAAAAQWKGPLAPSTAAAAPGAGLPLMGGAASTAALLAAQPTAAHAQGGIGGDEQEPVGLREEARVSWGEPEEDWQDASDSWGQQQAGDGLSSQRADSMGQQGPGFSALAAAGLGLGFDSAVGWGWEGVGMVLMLVLWPTYLLLMLHSRLAAVCWEGWDFRSRQQRRQWARGRGRQYAAFKGWSIRQWLLAGLLILLLLLAWCSCAAEAMDPKGLENSLLLTAGIAVLRMRHPGGAARIFHW